QRSIRDRVRRLGKCPIPPARSCRWKPQSLGDFSRRRLNNRWYPGAGWPPSGTAIAGIQASCTCLTKADAATIDAFEPDCPQHRHGSMVVGQNLTRHLARVPPNLIAAADYVITIFGFNLR